MATVTGGEKTAEHIARLVAKLKRGGVLKVGFLEGATYPDGTPVALVAAVQNFGAPSRGIPPRPFFSDMVSEKSPTWGDSMNAALKATDGDTVAALNIMGDGIKGQLQTAIRDFSGVPLAPSTVKAKGFDKQLIDTAHMLDSVDYKVTT